MKAFPIRSRLPRAACVLAFPAILAAMPPASMAFDLCESQAKRLALYAEMAPFENAVKERRIGDLDRRMNALIADEAAKRISDQALHRWFWDLFGGTSIAMEPMYRDWIAAHPRSAAAYLASAYYYDARGWAVRGNKFAPDTSDSQFDQMRREFVRALALLDKADEIRKTSLSAALRLDMLVGMSSARIGEFHRRYVEGVHDFPGSLELRVIYLQKSAPKWGGSAARQRAVEEDLRDLGPDDRRYVHYILLEDLAGDRWVAEDKAGAAALYEEAIPLCPGLDGAIESLMRVEEQMEDYDALIRTLGTYIARYPSHGWGYAKRGWAQGHKLRWKESFEDDEKSASLGFGHGYGRLAWHYEMGYGVKQDYKRAIELYDIAFAHGEADAGTAARRLRANLGVKTR